MNDIVKADEPIYQNAMFTITLGVNVDQDNVTTKCLVVTNRDTGIIELKTLKVSEAYAHVHNSEEVVTRVRAAGNVIPFRRTKQ
jgi:hypothetical protein